MSPTGIISFLSDSSTRPGQGVIAFRHSYIIGNPGVTTFHDDMSVFSLPKLKMLDRNVINNQHHVKIEKLWSGVIFVEDLPKILQPKETFLDLPTKELHDVKLLQSDSLTDLNSKTQIEWELRSLPYLVVWIFRITNFKFFFSY
jgi:hypothetical protein